MVENSAQCIGYIGKFVIKNEKLSVFPSREYIYFFCRDEFGSKSQRAGAPR